MGIYLNPSADGFASIMKTGDYVDKTGLLEYTNSVLNTTEAYICNCRPRRFGKSYAANMLAAYYSKGCNSEEMFSGLDISRESDFNNRSKNSLTSIGTPLKKSLFCIKQYNIKCFYLF